MEDAGRYRDVVGSARDARRLNGTESNGGAPEHGALGRPYHRDDSPTRCAQAMPRLHADTLKAPSVPVPGAECAFAQPLTIRHITFSLSCFPCFEETFPP